MQTDCYILHHRTSFDETAELICEKLRDLDRLVAVAVVNEVTETFGVPDDPIDHLVKAATAPKKTQMDVSVLINVCTLHMH